MLTKGRTMGSVLAFCLTALASVPADLHAQDTARVDRVPSQALSSDAFRARLQSLVTSNATLPAAPGGLAEPSHSSSASPGIPSPPEAEISDEKAKEASRAYTREYWSYYTRALEHRRQIFQWQLLSSKIIFWAVLALVFAGIYFAAVQFHASLGRDVRAADQLANPEPEQAKVAPTERVVLTPDMTELSASLEGIKVRSPILGVIILVISLAFFYLYLQFVYPIEEIL
jgi:hypothetical protein